MKTTSAEAKACPTPFQSRVLWRAVTGVAFAVVGALVVGTILLTGKVLAYLQPVLVPVAVAGILAYLLDPIVVRIRRDEIFGRQLSRIQAILLVYVIAVLAIALLCLSVVPPLVGQISNLVNNRSQVAEKARQWADVHLVWVADLIDDENPPPDPSPTPADADPNTNTDADPDTPADPDTSEETPEETPADADTDADAAESPAEPPADEGAGKTIAAKIGDWFRSDAVLDQAGIFIVHAMQGLFGTLAYIVGFALVPVYLFFFLKDSARIRDHWKDYVPLKASKLKDEVVSVLQEINGYLIAYFRGQVLVSLIDGVLTGIALTLMGLPYAVVIGVFLALLGVIPFVGIIVTWVPAVLIAAAHYGDWQHPLVVTIIFIVIQQVDGNVIQPKIVGDSVGLHPLTIIFSVLFWSLLIGGLLGALLAVPLTAALKVLFQRYVWERRIGPSIRDQPTASPSPA